MRSQYSYDMSQKEMQFRREWGGRLGVRAKENKLPKEQVDIPNYKILLRCYTCFLKSLKTKTVSSSSENMAAKASACQVIEAQ